MDKPLTILILDDEDVRHTAFALRFKGENVVHVRDPWEAIQKMQETTFDAVFLDHDLAWTEYTPYPKEVTGTDVARAMTQMPEHCWPGLTVIHSHNVVGAARMHLILGDAGFKVALERFDGSSPKNK